MAWHGMACSAFLGGSVYAAFRYDILVVSRHGVPGLCFVGHFFFLRSIVDSKFSGLAGYDQGVQF